MTRREADRRRWPGVLALGLLLGLGGSATVEAGSMDRTGAGMMAVAPAKQAMVTPVAHPEPGEEHDHDNQPSFTPESDPESGEDNEQSPSEDEGQSGTPGGQGDGQDDPDGGEDEPGDAGGQDGEEGAQAAEGCGAEGLPLHDGAQEGLRCVPTALGEVPDPAEIPRVLLTSPASGETLPVGEPFVVEAAVRDMATGSFANPDEDYYQEPQRLTDEGLVIGHAHIAIQQLSQEQGEVGGVPEAQDLVFFQGLNEQADAEGTFQVEVEGGLEEPGTYRILMVTGATSHQPVISPVAEHFAPVDVIRVQAAEEGEAGQGGNDGSSGDIQFGGAAVAADLDGQDPGTGGATSPGDGVPPPPVGGGGAGDGGTGDHDPPPSTDAPGDRTPSDPAVPVGSEDADSGVLPFWGASADAVLVGGGVLIAVGVGLVALARRRGRPAYQGRHLPPQLPSGAQAWSESLTELLPEESEQLDQQRGRR